MASGAILRPVHSKLLSLPAHIRVKAYQQTRGFSASTPNRLNLVDIAVAGPNAILDGVHALGIPWGAAIPISAVFVRTVLVHIVATRPARRRAQLQSHLLPLASARLMQELNYRPEQTSMRKKRGNAFTSAYARPLRRALEPLRRMWLGMKIMRKLSKDFGAGRFRPWGLLNFGMLIAFTEAIRMKCGTREGLLPILVSPFTWIGRKIAPTHFPEPPQSVTQSVPQDPAEILAEKLWAAREALGAKAQQTGLHSLESAGMASSQEVLLDQTSSEMSPEIISYPTNPYFDPSMQTEGLPWITDLTLPDPTIILPSALFVGLLANSVLRPRPGDTTPATKYSLLQGLTRGQRIGVVVACAFGLLSAKMPAAILLYFGPSIVAGWLHGRWLDYKYPMLPAIRPCKRPVKMEFRQMR